MPVFLKPIVQSEMTQYVHGDGAKRDWRNYNTKLAFSAVDVNPVIGSEVSTITFSCLVTSEVPRDPNNSTGKVVNRKLRSGAVKKIRKPSAPEKFIDYKVVIQFHAVEFAEDQTEITPRAWTYKGKPVYSSVPSINRNPCRIKCTCRDFMFVWEKPLADDDGLYPIKNSWNRYQRITPPPPVGRPKVNPNNKMGYCKHIATVLAALARNGELIMNESQRRSITKKLIEKNRPKVTTKKPEVETPEVPKKLTPRELAIQRRQQVNNPPPDEGGTE